jgi:hypothetical protein
MLCGELLPKFRRNLLLPCSHPNVTSHGANPEAPATSDFTAARARSISRAFLLFAYFIFFEHVFSSVLWRESPIPHVFLMTQKFNINSVPPVALFSFSLLCLYLSLPLTAYLVDCKILFCLRCKLHNIHFFS